LQGGISHFASIPPGSGISKAPTYTKQQK